MTTNVVQAAPEFPLVKQAFKGEMTVFLRPVRYTDYPIALMYQDVQAMQFSQQAKIP